VKSGARRTAVRTLLVVASAASLALCLAAPILYLLARIGDRDYKTMLLAGTIGWFLCAAALTVSNYAKPGEP